jgi:hypothetical protein
MRWILQFICFPLGNDFWFGIIICEYIYRLLGHFMVIVIVMGILWLCEWLIYIVQQNQPHVMMMHHNPLPSSNSQDHGLFSLYNVQKDFLWICFLWFFERDHVLAWREDAARHGGRGHKVFSTFMLSKSLLFAAIRVIWVQNSPEIYEKANK